MQYGAAIAQLLTSVSKACISIGHSRAMWFLGRVTEFKLLILIAPIAGITVKSMYFP